MKQTAQFEWDCQTFYCYWLAPVDFWHGAVPWNDYIKQIEDEYAWELKPPTGLIAHKYRKLEAAQDACRELLGWEGDLREGPFVVGLPTDSSGDGSDGLDEILMWKQDNNGTTFVVSPYPLPWLERNDM